MLLLCELCLVSLRIERHLTKLLAQVLHHITLSCVWHKCFRLSAEMTTHSRVEHRLLHLVGRLRHALRVRVESRRSVLSALKLVSGHGRRWHLIDRLRLSHVPASCCHVFAHKLFSFFQLPFVMVLLQLQRCLLRTVDVELFQLRLVSGLRYESNLFALVLAALSGRPFFGLVRSKLVSFILLFLNFAIFLLLA